MSFRDYLKKPEVFFRLGMFTLAINGLLRFVVHPTGASEDLYDGIHGFLLGVSISSLLVWIVRKRKGSSTT